MENNTRTILVSNQNIWSNLKTHADWTNTSFSTPGKAEDISGVVMSYHPWSLKCNEWTSCQTMSWCTLDVVMSWCLMYMIAGGSLHAWGSSMSSCRLTLGQSRFNVSSLEQWYVCPRKCFKAFRLKTLQRICSVHYTFQPIALSCGILFLNQFFCDWMFLATFMLEALDFQHLGPSIQNVVCTLQQPWSVLKSKMTALEALQGRLKNANWDTLEGSNWVQLPLTPQKSDSRISSSDSQRCIRVNSHTKNGNRANSNC